MRDAARSAEMSDPDQNRWFRRRWVETGPHRPLAAAGPIPVDTAMPVFDASAYADTPGDAGDLALLGQELLAAWRRERAQAGG